MLLEGQKSRKILQSCEMVSRLNFQVQKKEKKKKGKPRQTRYPYLPYFRPLTKYFLSCSLSLNDKAMQTRALAHGALQQQLPILLG